MSKFESESRLTFMEATGIIVGHGVGAGILSVPYLASLNSWWVFIVAIIIATIYSFLLHIMIAELSYNNNGAQFVKCMENTIFKGRAKKVFIYISLLLLGLSVFINCAVYLEGSRKVISDIFGINKYVSLLIYYVISALVVFFGMKFVGICEKYSIYGMIAIILFLTVFVIIGDKNPLPIHTQSFKASLALFGVISFSLSAVMSVPQVVKGLDGDPKRIRQSIGLGIFLNVILIIVLTLITIISSGENISEDGALSDLSRAIGGWVQYVGYAFNILALSTSFWANTLNLRDMIHESSKLNLKLSWVFASLPSLLIALIGSKTFVDLTLLASAVQIVTGLVIMLAYNSSRKKTELSPICGTLGMLPFQIFVIIASIVASLGVILQ